MSALFNWFVGVTREFASGLGHQPTAVDAGRGGEVPNALPPSSSREVMPTETGNTAPVASVMQASLKTSGLASVIDIEMARVQRVMDAHNYAGSGMSRARFDAEVSLGIKRMRAEEENQLEEK